MPWIIGGALLGSSLIGSRSSANAIEDSSEAAVAEQRRQFDVATGLARPSIEAGDTARNQLLRLLGLPVSNAPTPTGPPRGGGRFGDLPPNIRNQLGLDTQGLGGLPQTGPPAASDPLDIIRNTPGFQFQTEQGTRALNAIRSAGGSSGGDLIRDFTRFNQGVASDFYRDYANRLANLSGTGQQAALTSGNQAIAAGQGISNSLLGAGEARASGILGVTGGLQDLFGSILGGIASGEIDPILGG